MGTAVLSCLSCSLEVSEQTSEASEAIVRSISQTTVIGDPHETRQSIYPGVWGDWDTWDFCPQGTFAKGIAARVESTQGNGDDTALNGVHLVCSDRAGTSESSLVSLGTWGTWGSTQTCSEFLVGAELKVEAPQGNGDDTAANDIRGLCSDGQVKSSTNGGPWGSWQGMRQCPVGTAICGMRGRVELPQGNGDDTGLNGLEVACCSTSTAVERRFSSSCNGDTLSPLALSVWTATLSSNQDATLAPSKIRTGCNSLDKVYVDGPSIFPGIADMIAQAKNEVDLAFFEWDPASEASRHIGEGLRRAIQRRSSGDRLLVRMLIDDNELPGTSRAINHIYDAVKNWGLDSNRVTIQLATHDHYSPVSLMHDKLVVVDSRLVFVTGANVAIQHQAFYINDNKPVPGWHDTGYALSGATGLSAEAHFDDAWNEHARHWECRPRTLALDCQTKSGGHPQPSRGWHASIPRATGQTSVLALTRAARGDFNNDSLSDQDAGWRAAMAEAQQRIDIATPNINDDAFRDAVVAAVGRGVKVRLVTGNDFNRFATSIIGQGGHNTKIYGDLVERVRASHYANRHLLELRFFSREGERMSMGKHEGANHTKYMSVDGKFVIVGSGNMDTQSWNQSREYNVLIDDPAAVTTAENAFFNRDWVRGKSAVFGLGSSANGQGSLQCAQDAELNFVGDVCDKDLQFQSARLYHVPAGRTFRLFEGSTPNVRDDWIEVETKRDIEFRTVPNFLESFEDTEIRVSRHYENGLNGGEVGTFQSSGSATVPLVDFYEGNSATQNLVCVLPANSTQNVNFKNTTTCVNDEARSVRLHNIPAGVVVRLTGHPDCKTNEGYVDLHAITDQLDRVVSSFHSSWASEGLRVESHRQGHTLDGKISCMTTFLPRRVVGDFTGDGRDEIFVYGGTEAAVHRYDGNGNWTVIWKDSGSEGITPYAQNRKLIAGDFDGDGADEVMGYGGSWTTMFHFENGNWHWGWSDGGINTGISPYARDHQLIAGDFDGDQRDEVMGYGRAWTTMFHFEDDHQWHWGWSDGGINTGISPYARDHQLIAGDFDGDQRDEVMGYGGAWTTMFHFEDDHQWHWGWSDGGINTGISPYARHQSLLSGDFDGDQRDEILGYGSGGWSTMFHFENDHQWHWGWSDSGENWVGRERNYLLSGRFSLRHR